MPKSFVLHATLVALALAGGSALAAGKAEVSYVKPDNFSDAGRSSTDRDATQKTLTAWLQKLALDLPDGQVLKVEVLDIDLAGEIRTDQLREVRVLRGGADWPRIQLRWTLAGPAGAASAGEAQLADMSYLQHISLGEAQNDTLAYEKRMLQRWFKDTFATH